MRLHCQGWTDLLVGRRPPICIPSLHPLPLGLLLTLRPCISRHTAPCVPRLHPADYSIGKGAYWVTIRQLLDWMRNPVPASQLKLSMAMCGRAPPPPPPSAPLPSSGINITLVLEGAALLLLLPPPLSLLLLLLPPLLLLLLLPPPLLLLLLLLLSLLLLLLLLPLLPLLLPLLPLLLLLVCRAGFRWCACPGGAYCRRHLRWRYSHDGNCFVSN